MLIDQTPQPSQGRVLRRERKLWDQPNLTPSLGCQVCPERLICGGLRQKLQMFDCLERCCGKPERCTTVCRERTSGFTANLREIGGFDLSRTPRSVLPVAIALPRMVPLIYHGKMRHRPFEGEAIALSLHRLLDKRTGLPKFQSEEALRQEFRLAPDVQIVLSGTDQDAVIERWWRFGADVRLESLRLLRILGIRLVTTPNFSLFADTPRWDNLHAMKRIAIVHSEIQSAGITAALHVNGRTDRDFERWGEFIGERPEIAHLSYEFTTGSGRAERKAAHVKWLRQIARKIDRPLSLVVRGGLEVLSELAEDFSAVTVLETSAFMKATKRQMAVRSGNANIKWEFCPTSANEPVDHIFEANVAALEQSIALISATHVRRMVSAAA